MLQSIPSTPTRVYQAVPWVSPLPIHTWCSSCSFSRVHSPRKIEALASDLLNVAKHLGPKISWCHWMFFFPEDLMRQLPKMMRKRSWGLKQLKIKSVWMVVSNMFKTVLPTTFGGKFSNLTKVFQMGWSYWLEMYIFLERMKSPSGMVFKVYSL